MRREEIRDGLGDEISALGERRHDRHGQYIFEGVEEVASLDDIGSGRVEQTE